MSWPKGVKNPEHSKWMKENNPMRFHKTAKKSGKARKGNKYPSVSECMKGENHPFFGKKNLRQIEWMKNGGAVYINSFNNSTEQREKQKEYMKNGGAAYVCSCNKSPSKPQVQLFEMVKLLHPSAVLNFPYLNYSIDIAIPELKIAIEYDGSYWHQDEEKDRKRQLEIEQQGWKVIRYKDSMPTEAELKGLT